MRCASIVIPSLGLAWAAIPAFAAISGVSGAVQQISPPALVMPGVSYASAVDTASVWDELQGVAVSGLAMDLVNNPGDTSSPVAGTISGVVDSHYLDYRHTTMAPANGSVSFSGKILGVAYSFLTLDPSDAPLGASGTTYIPGPPRGMSPWGPDFFAINGNVLKFSLVGDPMYLDTVQVRVLTEHVPAPGVVGAAGVFGTAGLTFLRCRRRR